LLPQVRPRMGIDRRRPREKHWRVAVRERRDTSSRPSLRSLAAGFFGCAPNTALRPGCLRAIARTDGTMRHRDQRSELAPAPSGGPGPAPALVAREPIIDALHQVISDLFAVGLQLHLTVGDFDPDS